MMGQRTSRFRQVDLTRALKGAVAAGIEVKRISIDAKGTIVLVIDAEKQDSDLSEYDLWKETYG